MTFNYESAACTKRLRPYGNELVQGLGSGRNRSISDGGDINVTNQRRLGWLKRSHKLHDLHEVVIGQSRLPRLSPARTITIASILGPLLVQTPVKAVMQPPASIIDGVRRQYLRTRISECYLDVLEFLYRYSRQRALIRPSIIGRSGRSSEHQHFTTEALPFDTMQTPRSPVRTDHTHTGPQFYPGIIMKIVTWK